MPNPEEITDWARLGVMVPRLLVVHPIRIARALPLGAYFTIHTQRRLHAEGRRLRKTHTTPVWVEYQLPAPGGDTGTARWYTAAMILPLADVKEGMEFLR